MKEVSKTGHFKIDLPSSDAATALSGPGNSFLKKFESNVDTQKKILDGAEKLESDSNQLLNFTNIIKKNDKSTNI